MGQTEEIDSDSGLQSQISIWLNLRLKFINIAVLILSLISYLASTHVIFELMNCFRFYYFLSGILLLTLYIWKKEKFSMIISLLIILLNLFQINHLFLGKNITEASSTEKLLLMNVFTANQKCDLVIDYIKEENPDYIALMEINNRWEREIKSALSGTYPSQLSIPRSDNFGLMFLSKTVFKGTTHWSEAEIPFIEAKFQNFSIWLAHPLPPISNEHFILRNKTIEEVSNLVKSQEKNIICGDFNAVPWSPAITHLKQHTKTKNTADGFGVNHTWPAHLPLPGIAIDHCFISEDGNVIAFKKGPNLGSDHYPIIVEFSFD